MRYQRAWSPLDPIWTREESAEAPVRYCEVPGTPIVYVLFAASVIVQVVPSSPQVVVTADVPLRPRQIPDPSAFRSWWPPPTATGVHC